MVEMKRVKDSEIPQEYVAQVAKMQDKLFLEFGVEQEHYNQAIVYHKLN